VAKRRAKGKGAGAKNERGAARSGGKRKAGKTSGRRDLKAATAKLEGQLKEMKAKLREMMIEAGDDPDALAVQSAKDFAEQMQEINRGFRETLKRAAMADGKLKPGDVLTVQGRRVFLKPRPGCPEGSMDPEHYDLTYEMIQ